MSGVRRRGLTPPPTTTCNLTNNNKPTDAKIHRKMNATPRSRCVKIRCTKPAKGPQPSHEKCAYRRSSAAAGAVDTGFGSHSARTRDENRPLTGPASRPGTVRTPLGPGPHRTRPASTSETASRAYFYKDVALFSKNGPFTKHAPLISMGYEISFRYRNSSQAVMAKCPTNPTA
jgi:hypothetical protein